MVDVCFKPIEGCTLPLPAYQSAGASGIDLQSNQRRVTIGSGAQALISTGFKIMIPPGFEGQIRPRSGLAFKHGVTVLNAPGTVDSDYRGEIKVLLINHGAHPFEIEYGDRIAQLVVAPVTYCEIRLVDTVQFNNTIRGEDGFGSTGVGDAVTVSPPRKDE